MDYKKLDPSLYCSILRDFPCAYQSRVQSNKCSLLISQKMLNVTS